MKALEHFRNVFFELRPLHWHVLPSTSSACAAAIARSIGGPPASNRITVSQVFLLLLHQPAKYLLHRWNWKSALLSSLIRAGLFFATNVAAGFPAALAAMKTELVFRGVTSGFYGALTQAFREAEPAWAAAIAVMILLPLANHSLELFVHWMRGTQKLLPSIGASMVLTVFSTLFNFYVMRRGTLIVGAGGLALYSAARAGFSYLAPSISNSALVPNLQVRLVAWPLRRFTSPILIIPPQAAFAPFTTRS